MFENIPDIRSEDQYAKLDKKYARDHYSFKIGD